MTDRPVITFVAIALLGLAAQVEAHSPPGELFFAAQFPDEAVPAMDGNPSDWRIVPETPYHIRTDRMSAADPSIGLRERGSSDPSDLSMNVVVGWNNSANKLYFLTEVFDNIHNTDRPDVAQFWEDDDIEINLNPSHVPKEEQNLEGEPTNNQYYGFTVPPIEGQYFYPQPAHPWLTDKSSWVDFGWSFTGEQYGESTYFYEAGITPMLSVPIGESVAENQVESYDLEEGDIIHFTVDIGDFDEPGQTYNSFWGVSADRACCAATSDLLLAELDPLLLEALASGVTAVEQSSWGRIKAGRAMSAR